MQYVPFGMHHADAGYDVNDPELTTQQRELVEFSSHWFNVPRENYKPKLYKDNPALTRMHELATPEISRKHGQPVLRAVPKI